MRRPLALIGLTAMLVLAVCFYSSVFVSVLIFVISVLGLILSISVTKIRRMQSPVAVFATIMLSVVLFNMFSQFYVMPIKHKYTAEDAEISAVLREEGVYDNGVYFYEIKAVTVNGKKADVRMSLSSSEALMCKVGDRINFTSDINQADYSRYLADRIYLTTNVYYEDQVEIIPADNKPLYAYIVELRENIRSSLYLELKYDNASLASAILLGDKSGFEDNVYQDMKRAGLTHVVVVSGLHLSIITMIYMRLFGKLIKNKYLSLVCQVLLVLFFLCLTGFGKSTLRAAIMLFVLMIAGVFNRENDSVNSLGFASILMFITNPYIVGDVGVLLSFSATFGIVAFSRNLEDFLTKGLTPVGKSRHKILNKALRYTAALFSTTFTAVVATLPVTVIFFGRVSLVQVISNLIILPFVQYFMMLAALVSILHFIPFLWWMTEAFAFLADLLGDLMLALVRIFASVPFAYVKADYKFVLFWLVSSILIFGLIYLLRRKGRGLNIFCAVLSVIILLSGAVGHILVYRNTVTFYVLPADNGQGVVVDSPYGNVLLLSSDDNYTCRKAIYTLEDVYTEHQLMVCLSGDSSESLTSSKISDLFDYNQVLMYDTDNGNNHSKAMSDSKQKVSITSGNSEISLFDEMVLYIRKYDGKLYQYLVCRDTSMLILPDLADVQNLPENMRNPDILITSGLAENMELLNFNILIANGSDFEISAVIDYYRDHPCKKIAVNDTITFDITG